MNKEKLDIAFIIMRRAYYKVFDLHYDFEESISMSKRIISEASKDQLYVNIYTEDYFDDSELIFTFLCDKKELGKNLLQQFEKKMQEFDLDEFMHSFIKVPCHCDNKKNCQLYQKEYEKNFYDKKLMEDFENKLREDVRQMRTIYDCVNKYPDAAEKLALSCLAMYVVDEIMTNRKLKGLSIKTIKNKEKLCKVFPEIKYLDDDEYETLKGQIMASLDVENVVEKCPLCGDNWGMFTSIDGDLYCVECKKIVRKNCTNSFFAGFTANNIIHYFELYNELKQNNGK